MPSRTARTSMTAPRRLRRGEDAGNAQVTTNGLTCRSTDQPFRRPAEQKKATALTSSDAVGFCRCADVRACPPQRVGVVTQVDTQPFRAYRAWSQRAIRFQPPAMVVCRFCIGCSSAYLTRSRKRESPAAASNSSLVTEAEALASTSGATVSPTSLCP